MANVEIKIEGLSACINNFNKLKRIEPMIRPIIAKNLAEMKNRSNQLTPKKTGELRNSAYANIISTTEGEFGYSKEYAPYVEYGHRIVMYGKDVGFCPAKPFLKPNKELQSKIFSNDINNIVKKVVK